MRRELHTVKQHEITSALDPKRAADDKQAFIRTRFEALYDHLEQLEHLISLGILDFADVEIPFRYYMRNLLSADFCPVEFFDYFDYPGAKAFAFRFAERGK